MSLEKLNWDKDFKVADGYTDIRGWSLFDSGSNAVGRVDDLLFDTNDREVRYAIASIDNRRTLIPIGQVDIDSTNRRLVTRGYDRAGLSNLREYREDNWNDNEERGFFSQFMPNAGTTDRLDYRNDTFRGKELPQTIQLIEERLRVGKREAQIGEVEVSKRPITETVEEQVELRRDRIEIERHEVNRPAAKGETVIGDAETIRVPVYGEEVVAEKTPFVKEEVTLRNNPEVHRETVREDVTHEELVTNGLDENRKRELSFSGTEPTDADRIEKREIDVDVIPNDRKGLL
jgi:uncharacterized protein (TIGR02271 family)